jgi:hypothetical protein
MNIFKVTLNKVTALWYFHVTTRRNLNRYTGGKR